MATATKPPLPSISLKPSARRTPTDPSKVMTLFVMIVVTLYFGREVLIPIALAQLLAFLLVPLVSQLRRMHLGRIPSVLLVVTVTIGILLALGSVIGSQIGSLAGDLPKYTATIETKVSTLKAATLGRLTKLVQTNNSPNATPSPVSRSTASQFPSQPAHAGKSAPAQAQPAPYRAADPAQQLGRVDRLIRKIRRLLLAAPRPAASQR